MKLEIEINNHVATLNDWASVSRTLTESIRLLNEMGMSGLFGDEMDALDLNLDELAAIVPALDALHHAVRSKMWEQTGGVGGVK